MKQQVNSAIAQVPLQHSIDGTKFAQLPAAHGADSGCFMQDPLDSLIQQNKRVISWGAQVRDKMTTAQADTVGNVDKYTKKYKPYADKYNK